MGYVASLYLLTVRLLRQAREWNERVGREHDGGTHDFHEIFLFGPHG